MNANQKAKIISMRKRQVPYAAIAEAVGLSVGTVKSFCHRNHIMSEEKTDVINCKNCGAIIMEESNTKPRLFCGDHCRQNWWNKHRTERQSNKILPHTCSVCGNVFMDYAGANRKYCSQACYRKGSAADEQ